MMPSHQALLLSILCFWATGCVSIVSGYGPSPEQWASKSILHILTDRFALEDCPANPRPCKDLDNACGGNHIGLRHRLDYIQDMGFDAVWVSPVTSQTGGPVRELQDGWHGYWPKNLWDLNSGFGTPKDFADLTKAMHDRGMWVMLDIVPNHSGYFAEENIHEMTFDKPDYYHSCNECQKGTCNGKDESPRQLEICRIKGLPDLNQTVPYVAETLHKWMAWIRDEFQIDGFRVDAAKHMPAKFMQDMKKRANIMTLGEVLNMDWNNGTRHLANMVNTNQLYSQLSYGLYGASGRVFLGPDGKTPYKPANTTLLKEAIDIVMETMPTSAHLLGNFMDNHDMPRLASYEKINEDLILNSLVFTYFIPGIPIVFYGTEAQLEVQREPLWENSTYDRTAPFYVNLKMLNWYRQDLKLWQLSYEPVYVDGFVFAFSRGSAALVVLSGYAAKQHPEELPRTVALTNLPEGMRGTTLYNIFDPNVTLLVHADGTADLQLTSISPLVFVEQVQPQESFYPAKPTRLLMPVDQIILLVTLISMIITCTGIWWGFLQPPQWVLHCASCLSRNFTVKPAGTDTSRVELETDDSSDSDGDRCETELPSIQAKLEKHAARKSPERKSSTGGATKVDSAADLHKSTSLRCIAELDTDDEDFTLAAVRKYTDTAGHTPASSSAASTHSVQPLADNSIMHVAMEYTIPELGLDGFVFGGLGKVVDTFARDWPGDMVLCAPLYAAAYSDPAASSPKFISGPAVLRFDVQVGHTAHQVEVFDLNIAEAPAGKARRYLLLQANVFRHRTRSDIYSFASEHDMITWLSVVNQAVATVCLNWGVRRLQLHDYHGALSLQYMEKNLRPEVLYIAHNAHYNGVFALPTKQRRAYLYSMFNLNPAAVSQYTEHKSAFDTLHSLLAHMVEAQKGVGCAAVSPKYASEIRTRLSPFWQIPQDEVIGILNAMDPTGSWAGDSISADEAISRKTAAKLKLQQRMGLAVGEQFQLAIFLGRLTHQKGVDIIAEAAPQFMARHPKLQLLVLGPLGDVAGADAQEALATLAVGYPGRLVAPANHYVSGDEKDLVLAAADYCLCPSRYEPCGLVDIEFGWYGGLIIGNETGGLGKMPGFYFQAAAATVPHLAAKLSSAVHSALSISADKRRQLVADALARRFPVDGQMQAYQKLWRKIDTATSAAAASGRQQRAVNSDTDTYFAQSWQRRNLNLQAAMIAAAPPAGVVNVTVTRSLTSDEEKSPTPAVAVASTRSKSGGGFSLSRLSKLGHKQQPDKKVCKKYQQDEEITPKHAFSNYLVLLLQSMSMLPSLMLLAYMVLQQISRQTWSTCPLRPHDNEWLPGLNALGMRVVWQLVLSTAAAPMWTSLAFRKTPRDYVHTVCVTTVMCLLIVLLSFIWQQMMNIGLLLVSPFALAGAPLVSLGFMGCNQELSEVGYHLMLVGDAFKAFLLASCAALTVYSVSHLPFLAVTAVCAVLMTAVTTWLRLPDSLALGYKHLKLNMRWREQRVVTFSGPKSPHLALCVSVLDMMGLSVLGYFLCVTRGTAGMVAVNGVNFAAGIVGTGFAVLLLQSRRMQLHLHSATIVLAAVPAAALLKALVAWQFTSMQNVLVAVALIQVIMGSRGPLNGLLAMMTLPSREAVALWQLACVILSNLALLITLLVAGVLKLGPNAVVTPMLLALGFIEGLRLLCSVILSKTHPKENLCAL